MPLIEYKEMAFSKTTLQVIEQANLIIQEYARQGFDLTLRQLYYQFVSRDLIRNTQREYKRLGDIVNNARLAGEIDWNSIEDRTRDLRALSHWTSPADIIESAWSSFRIDKWKTQRYRVEVWIEKDALAGVIARVCNEMDVPYFSCRGYTSQSEMWSAGQRLLTYINGRQQPLILHLGDHDPSGIDMSRDIQDRLSLFTRGRFDSEVNFKRIALNRDQIDEYNPPPNPAKSSDSRYTSYNELHGDESWELDALDPRVISDLVRSHIDDVVDDDAWVSAVTAESGMRDDLEKTFTKWPDVQRWLNGGLE